MWTPNFGLPPPNFGPGAPNFGLPPNWDVTQAFWGAPCSPSVCREGGGGDTRGRLPQGQYLGGVTLNPNVTKKHFFPLGLSSSLAYLQISLSS